MIQQVIARINDEMIETFDEVFKWFDSEQDLLTFNPGGNSWSVAQILEHISLTNHYLMVLIRKGVNKSLEKSTKVDVTDMIDNYDLDWNALKTIGEHKSFEWNRPAHMDPLGNKTMGEVKETMRNQLQDGLALLHSIKNGEGLLHATMMSVNRLGKIDVYHYLYFLVQHARRHLTQMEKIKTIYCNK